MVKLIVFYLLLLVCCGYALLRGGAPERIGAAIYAIGTALTVLTYRAWAQRFGAVEVGIMALDLATTVALLVLALRARRWWPLWVTALQAVSTVGHLAKLADPQMIRWAYAFLLGIWSYPILAIIAFGTFNHQRRLKRFGSDPSWSSFSGRSGRPAAPMR